jgi:hypothetical protein
MVDEGNHAELDDLGFGFVEAGGLRVDDQPDLLSVDERACRENGAGLETTENTIVARRLKRMGGVWCGTVMGSVVGSRTGFSPATDFENRSHCSGIPHPFDHLAGQEHSWVRMILLKICPLKCCCGIP